MDVTRMRLVLLVSSHFQSNYLWYVEEEEQEESLLTNADGTVDFDFHDVEQCLRYIALIYVL